MKPSNFVLFYVKSPAASAAFYEKLLATSPSSSRPALPCSSCRAASSSVSGSTVPSTRRPMAVSAARKSCSTATTDAAVDATHGDWAAKGAEILQKPTLMDFGYTFTAADPDGHRLRVYRRAENPV